jgi:beta-galactosidase
VWNEFDFSQPEVGGSIPYMNQKGLLTWDRKPKDVYYLYKANWNPAPMAYIASRGWTHRAGPATQPVDVYSNLPSVELFANGRSLGRKTPNDVKRASWEVPFMEGENVLTARGSRDGVSYDDRLVVRFTGRPAKLADAAVPFTELGVNVGGKAQVADANGLVWLGDQPYVAGGFGYVGGTPTMFDKDLPITFTPQPPLYFTYQEGLSSYKLDVPDGEYEVELLFAEPSAKPGERVFGVSVNGRSIAEALDLSASHGIARAVTYPARVTASGGAGITVQFVPVNGKAILNAIHVRKR